MSINWYFHWITMSISKEKIATSWDPSVSPISCLCSTYWTMMMNLDHLAQPNPLLHHTHGSWSRAQMRVCLIMGDNGRACVVILSLIDGIHSSSIHLETHEDVLCPHSDLGAPQVICLDIKGPTPFSLCLELIHLSWNTLDSIRHLQYVEERN